MYWFKFSSAYHSRVDRVLFLGTFHERLTILIDTHLVRSKVTIIQSAKWTRANWQAACILVWSINANRLLARTHQWKRQLGNVLKEFAKLQFWTFKVKSVRVWVWSIRNWRPVLLLLSIVNRLWWWIHGWRVLLVWSISHDGSDYSDCCNDWEFHLSDWVGIESELRMSFAEPKNRLLCLLELSLATIDWPVDRFRSWRQHFYDSSNSKNCRSFYSSDKLTMPIDDSIPRISARWSRRFTRTFRTIYNI